MHGFPQYTNDKMPFFTFKFLFFSVHSKGILLQKLRNFVSLLTSPSLSFFFLIKSANITSACYIFKELMCSSLYSLLLSSSLSVFLQFAAFIPTSTSLTSRLVFSAHLISCSF